MTKTISTVPMYQPSGDQKWLAFVDGARVAGVFDSQEMAVEAAKKVAFYE